MAYEIIKDLEKHCRERQAYMGIDKARYYLSAYYPNSPIFYKLGNDKEFKDMGVIDCINNLLDRLVNAISNIYYGQKKKTQLKKVEFVRKNLISDLKGVV